jgi:hypothetical protein
MADIGPPLGLIAIGLVLWLAVTASIAGLSIQTVGLILTIIGVVWLLIELFQFGTARRRGVVVRERDIY